MYEQKTAAEVRAELDSMSPGGLSSTEAERRLKQYGLNELAKQKDRSLAERILAQFMDPLIYVLIAAGIISVFLGEYGDAAIIAAVAILNATVGLIQEGKAQRALDALKKMTRLKALVKRDGTVYEIDAAGLVPGDLVVLDAGCQVPADLRLTTAKNLKIEESALTGESVPSEKDAFFLAEKPLAVGDRRNLAYMSTNVTAGRGEGIVIATGMETEIGAIAKQIHEEPESMTPLQKRLGDLGGVLSILAIGLCAALFGLAVMQKRDVGEMLITAISLAVAAVPEGLPAVVTIVLALSVSRMAKVHTIVRRLPSVETLGAVNVVCSDKTGTLTQNKMTVETWEGAEELFLAFTLCSDARLTKDGGIGDPTELALLEYVQTVGNRNQPPLPRIAEIPFDSERKMMTTVHRNAGQTVSYTKGAPDVILARCNRVLSKNGEKPLTAEERKRIQTEIGALSGQALRVLAAAKKTGGIGTENDEKDMVFLGYAAMTDPPRPEVRKAMDLFQRAHVRTIMITGDHKETAFAIAKKLGIASRPRECMTGEEIDEAGEEKLADLVRLVNVFARVSSEHKGKIVRALKANGDIVAMTGDGVNDAPSLRAADVGIAMGKGGTDVARQASDIILTDDNFATIEKAIEEGRGIYENIKKSVIFLLSSNFGEIMTMFAAIAFALPSPLKASHILWINLITDSLPALALGTDKNDGERLMCEPPRKSSESLFARGGLTCTIFYGVLIAIISLTAFLRLPVGILAGAGLEITRSNLAVVLKDAQVLAHSQTYAFTVLGLSQLFHAIGMRNVERSVFRMNPFENLLMLAAVIIGFLLQFAVTGIPALVRMFQTVTLTGGEWRELLFLAAMPMVAHELLILLSKFRKKYSNPDKKLIE